MRFSLLSLVYFLVNVVYANSAFATALSTAPPSATGCTVTITRQPANFSVACVGSNVTVGVSTTGTVSGYQWYRLNEPIRGQVSSTLTLTGVTTTSNGTYYVKITDVCSRTLTSNLFSLFITAAPTAFSVVSGTACTGEPVRLQTRGCESGQVTWSNGQIGTTLSTTVAGAHSATCRVGACSAQASGTATFAPRASVTLTASSSTFCAGTRITLTATGQGGQYTFSGPGFRQSGASPVASVSVSGVYSVAVAGTGVCLATASVSVTALSTARITLQPGPSLSLCAGRYLAVPVKTEGAATAYQWSRNGQVLPGQTTSVLMLTAVQPTDAGSYSVLVTGRCGSPQASQSFMLGVLTPPAGPTLTAASRVVTVSSTPLSLTTLVTASPGNTLLLTGMGVATDGGRVPVSLTGVFSYSVAQVSANRCTGPSVAFSLTVVPPVSQTPTTVTACTNARVVLPASATAISYQWYKNGTTDNFRVYPVPGIITGTRDANLTLLASSVTAGKYLCRLTFANGETRFVGPFNVLVNPNCTARMATAQEPTTPLNVVIAPNPLPADGWLRATISGAGGQSLRVRLVSVKGETVRSQQWEQADQVQQVEWNLSSQPGGVYLLNVQTESGQHQTRVLKQ
jgi:hypothetical protein